MDIFIFALLLATAFLAGTLVLSLVLLVRHWDENVNYKLFAVRDRLIGAVVFDGVARDDPWFEWLYWQANYLLKGTHLVTGPSRWSFAAGVGARIGAQDEDEQPDPPSLECRPHPALEEILDTMSEALEMLEKEHIGWLALVTGEQRAKNARAKARVIAAEKKRAREVNRVVRGLRQAHVHDRPLVGC